MDNNTNAAAKSETSDAIIEEKITKVGCDPVIKKYSKGRLLGKGGFAKCYEVVSLENKKTLAAKIILKSSLTKSRAKQKLISEIKIHKSLRHSNVVGFEHVFEDADNVYILLELCPNQSMHDLIKRRKRLTELEVQCYTIQLINGLKYLHGRRVIHRDLKLGNLFINDKMELKIGDFGLAAKLDYDGEKRRTVCGTPNYIAPEIIEGKGGHSYEVDTWSVGVIIYTLLVGKPPFETADVKLTYKKIKACSYSFPEHVSVSETSKDLITKILNLEPSKRPSLEDILQHPFLRNGISVPKLLPTSTLTCAPSSSYLNQYATSDNSVKVAIPHPRSAEATPLGLQKTGRLNTNHTQRHTMTSIDKGLLMNPQSPNGQTNENVITAFQIDRNPSSGTTTETKGWIPTKPSTLQSMGISTAQSLKDLSRPQSVQQSNFKSSQRLKTGGYPFSNLGNTLRVSGAVTGFSRAKGSSSSTNDVWVKKWVDYSTKYGMGYTLSNGASGVLFNDNTRIICDLTSGKFNYIQRAVTDRQDNCTTHSLTEYPRELQKKVTLLQHFKTYLDGTEKVDIEEDVDCETVTSVHVKKWMKTKSATMFRLSNRVVQVNFIDKTEVILNSISKVVTFVNKKGERNNYPLTNALETGNGDLSKRLRYTKELLTAMLNGVQTGQIPTIQLQ